MSSESVMLSNHLFLCHPFFCLQSSPASHPKWLRGFLRLLFIPLFPLVSRLSVPFAHLITYWQCRSTFWFPGSLRNQLIRILWGFRMLSTRPASLLGAGPTSWFWGKEISFRKQGSRNTQPGNWETRAEVRPSSDTSLRPTVTPRVPPIF